MKIVKCKLYKFEELAEEVRKSIVDKERWNVGYWTMDGYNVDYNATLNEFEKLMGIKVSYSIDYCAYHFSAAFQSDYAFETYWTNSDYCISHEQCTGKLLRRWLNHNFMPFAIGKKKYYKADAGYDCEKHRWNKQRFSRIQWESWDNCPLTGTCYDIEIMKPIIDCLNKPIPENYSLRDLVDAVLQNFFESWHREYEYWCDNDDAIEEQLAVMYENKWFFDDGREFCGICEDVA